MGKFTTGNKMAGSRKGVKNKRTEQWEIFVEYCMNGGLKKFQEEMDMLEGKDYVIAFSNLMEFHKPKLTRSTIIGDPTQPINVNFIPIGKNSTGK